MVLIQILIANLVAIALLFACWRYPKQGRYAYGVVFLIASIVNTLTVLAGPSVYLEYRRYVFIKAYIIFMDRYFSQHIQQYILIIALGQFFIFLGLVYGRFLLKSALIGGIIFSIAIIPLGIGSAMPLPIFMGLSLSMLLFKKQSHSKTLI